MSFTTSHQFSRIHRLRFQILDCALINDIFSKIGASSIFTRNLKVITTRRLISSILIRILISLTLSAFVIDLIKSNQRISSKGKFHQPVFTFVARRSLNIRLHERKKNSVRLFCEHPI